MDTRTERPPFQTLIWRALETGSLQLSSARNCGQKLKENWNTEPPLDRRAQIEWKALWVAGANHDTRVSAGEAARAQEIDSIQWKTNWIIEKQTIAEIVALLLPAATTFAFYWMVIF